jgi:hypothetical protein
MGFANVVLEAVDLPLVVGIVILIQAAKKAIKINSKWWALVIVGLGFLAGWLRVEPFRVKDWIAQSLIYAAACEFVYQSWRTVKGVVQKKP